MNSQIATKIGSIAFGKDQASFYLYDHFEEQTPFAKTETWSGRPKRRRKTRITYTPTGFIAHPGDVSTSVNIINNVMDYFPYGKILREYVDGEQERYLTTQHERDTETDLDYRGARYYDNEVGRFLSLDPHARDYPRFSDYCYVGGNPIVFVDSDGKDFRIYYNDADGNQQSVQIKSVDNQTLQNAITESGNNKFVKQFVEAVQYVGEADRKDVFEKLAKRDEIIAVHLETGRDTQFSQNSIEADDECQFLREDESGIIAWNPLDGNEFLNDERSPTGEVSSPAINLLHEGGHGIIELHKPILFHVFIRFIGADAEQIVIRNYEKKAEQDLNEPVRRNRRDYENTRPVDVPNVTHHKKIKKEE